MNENLDWLSDVIVAQNSKVSKNMLVKSVGELYEENEQTRKAFAVKHQELLDTIQERNALKEQNEGLKSIKAGYDDAMKAITAKDNVIESLRSSNNNLKGTCDSWEKMYADLREENDTLMLENKELEALRIANEKAEQEVIELNKRTSELVDRIGVLEDERNAARRDAEEKAKDAENARRTLEETQKMYDEAVKANEKLAKYAINLQGAIKRQYEIGLTLMNGVEDYRQTGENEPANR